MIHTREFIKREDCEGWECTTLGDKFDESAKRYGDKPAVVDDENSLTYLELKNCADSMAGFFLGRGLEKGDTVVVQLPNKILFLAVFFGLMKIGAVPVLVLPAHREAVINGIFELAEPKAYITASPIMDKDFVSEAVKIAGSHGCGPMLFFDSELESILDPQYHQEILCCKPSYKDVAFMTLSGGTTGIPKMIPRTHGDYIYNSRVTVERCGWDEDTVFLAAIPAAHNFALGTPGVIGTLISGGTNVLTMYASPVDIFDSIEEYHVTAACMVPTLASLCAEYRGTDQTSDLSSLKYLLVGGATFSPADAARVREMFECTLIQVYGMAEGLTCATRTDDPDHVVLNTQGKPCSPYDEVRIVDENDCDVPDGTSGEILTRGPYTISAYYRLMQVQQTNFTKDGWYRTGDKGVITESGNLQILGRVKELINRAGEKIVPSMLEECICAHKKVNACSVVGVPDRLLGNRICPFIIKNTGQQLELEEVKEHLRKRGFADYTLPDQLFFIQGFPLTAVGKIDKNKLKAMAETVKRHEKEVALYE